MCRPKFCLICVNDVINDWTRSIVINNHQQLQNKKLCMNEIFLFRIILLILNLKIFWKSTFFLFMIRVNMRCTFYLLKLLYVLKRIQIKSSEGILTCKNRHDKSTHKVDCFLMYSRSVSLRFFLNWFTTMSYHQGFRAMRAERASPIVKRSRSMRLV